MQNLSNSCEIFLTNLDRLGVKQDEATLKVGRKPTPKLRYKGGKQRQRVYLKQLARTGGLWPPCKTSWKELARVGGWVPPCFI